MERPNISCYMEAALFRAVYWFVTPYYFMRGLFSFMYSTPRANVRRRLTYATPRTPGRSRAAVTQRFNRRYARGVSSRGPLRTQVKALQRAVNALAPEIKYVDQSLQVTNSPVGVGTIVHVSAIAQGDTTGARTGDLINVKQMALRWRFDRGTSTTTGFGFGARLFLLQDKQQIADTTAAATYFIDSSVSTAPVTGFPVIPNLERYRVLYQSPYIDFYRISTGNQSAQFEWNWTGNLKIEYNGTASSDIQKNGLYFVFCHNDSAATIDGDGVLRIGFTDV